MSKEYKGYKGYELIKEIGLGTLPDKLKFKFKTTHGREEEYIYIKDDESFFNTIDNTNIMKDFTLFEISYGTFELIEDEIDIQAIEEFKSEYTMNNVEFQIQDKLNELVQAVKQLDKKIKEK